MNILITGASGLVGSRLLELLFAKGHSFVSLQRNKNQDTSEFWKFDRIDRTSTSSPIDAVIHLAGENIASGRWTKRKKKLILDSRVEGTSQLARFCADLPIKPKVFVSASAIGYYGNRGTDLLDENSSAGTNFVAEVCQKWEAASAPVRDAGIRLVHGRIGMVISGKGGTLPTMLPSFKLGIAGVVGRGDQFLSWVDIDDLVHMILFVLEHPEITGPVNLVSPEPVTNRDFTKTLGSLVNRPTVMTMPAFVARAVFGQMGDELILSSCRVQPKVLQQHGYNFVSANLKKTLRSHISG